MKNIFEKSVSNCIKRNFNLDVIVENITGKTKGKKYYGSVVSGILIKEDIIKIQEVFKEERYNLYRTIKTGEYTHLFFKKFIIK
jgi:hypothetical protein